MQPPTMTKLQMMPPTAEASPYDPGVKQRVLNVLTNLFGGNVDRPWLDDPYEGTVVRKFGMVDEHKTPFASQPSLTEIAGRVVSNPLSPVAGIGEHALATARGEPTFATKLGASLDAVPVAGKALAASAAFPAAMMAIKGGADPAVLSRRFGPGRTQGGMFLGEQDVGADLTALERAQLLERSGVDRDRIWHETGWGRGVDGKWRFEIDDRPAQLTGRGSGAIEYRIDDEAELTHLFDHPGLMSRKPEVLQDVRGEVGYSPVGRGQHATAYEKDPATGEVRVVGEKLSARGPEPEDVRGTFLHELMHGVQDRNQFASGASYNKIAMEHAQRDNQIKQINEQLGTVARAMDAFSTGYNRPVRGMEDQYRYWKDKYDELMDLRGRIRGAESFTLTPAEEYVRHAGEVEARLVQKRADYSDAERRMIPPWQEYDVPEEQQIVKFKRR